MIADTSATLSYGRSVNAPLFCVDTTINANLTTFSNYVMLVAVKVSILNVLVKKPICSSDLSGTWSGFNLVKNQLEMNNMYIYDSRQVGAPVMDMALAAKQMADNDHDVNEIFEMLEMKTKNSFSFLAPFDFKQLARSGRLSPVAAKMASILKVKALLYLKEDGSCVDKYAMSRTESKIVKTVIDKFKNAGVNAKDYTLYISHADNEESALKAKRLLQDIFDNIEVIVNKLPAVLTCHGGMKCISVHYIHKM